MEGSVHEKNQRMPPEEDFDKLDRGGEWEETVKSRRSLVVMNNRWRVGCGLPKDDVYVDMERNGSYRIFLLSRYEYFVRVYDDEALSAFDSFC